MQSTGKVLSKMFWKEMEANNKGKTNVQKC